MSLAKRGLGRGLEALLVEVPLISEPTNSSTTDYDADAASPAQEIHESNHRIINTRQTEVDTLLQDAQALNTCLDDLIATLSLL